MIKITGKSQNIAGECPMCRSKKYVIFENGKKQCRSCGYMKIPIGKKRTDGFVMRT